MTVCIVLLVLGALALICYVREKLRAYTLKAAFWKSAVSAIFCATAVCAWQSAGGTQTMGAFTVLGLLFGLMGDIWLDLKYVYPAQDKPFTYAGFLTFGVGHILYMTGLILQFGRPGAAWYVVVPIALGVVLGLGNALLEKPMKLRYGDMKPIVIVYGALLFAMVLLAGGLALLHRWQAPCLNVFFAGGVLFALSDLVLSGTYFGENHEKPVDIILNYIFYYGGQFTIAVSLLFLR